MIESIEPTTAEVGQSLTFTLRYDQGLPLPTDVHVLIGSVPFAFWPSIPGWAKKKMEEDQPFTFGPVGTPPGTGPGEHEFFVRWSYANSTYVTDGRGKKVTFTRPAPATGEPARTKEKCIEGLGPLVIFPIPVISGGLLGLIHIGNEIKAASANRQSRDRQFASIAVPPKFEFAFQEEEMESYGGELLGLVGPSVQLQLKYCGVVHAAAVGTNRFYSANEAGDDESAAMHLRQIQEYLDEGRTLQGPIAQSLRRVADAVAGTPEDQWLSPEAVLGDQQELLETGRFPELVDARLKALFSQFDEHLVRIFEPYQVVRRLVLGCQPQPTGMRLSCALQEAASTIQHLDRVIGPFPEVHQLPDSNSKGE